MKKYGKCSLDSECETDCAKVWQSQFESNPSLDLDELRQGGNCRGECYNDCIKQMKKYGKCSLNSECATDCAKVWQSQFESNPSLDLDELRQGGNCRGECYNDCIKRGHQIQGEIQEGMIRPGLCHSKMWPSCSWVLCKNPIGTCTQGGPNPWCLANNC